MSARLLVLLAVATIAVAGGVLLLRRTDGANGPGSAPSSSESRHSVEIPAVPEHSGEERLLESDVDAREKAAPQQEAPSVVVTGATPQPEPAPVLEEASAPAGKAPAVSLILVDEDSVPIADFAWTVTFDHWIREPEVMDSSKRLRLRSDASGRIAIPLEAFAPFEKLRAFRLDAGSVDGPTLELRSSRRLTWNDRDLGTRVVKSARLHAAGTVVDEHGEPMAGVAVGLVPKGRPECVHGLAISATSDEKGCFEVRGSRFSKAAVVTAEAERHYPDPAHVDFTLGQRGIVVRMRAGSTLRGSVLVEPEYSFGLCVQVREGDIAGDPKRRGKSATVRARDGSFEIHGLRPGACAVDVSHDAVEGFLTTIPAVVMAGPESKLAAPIDLRGALKAIRVLVTDAGGRPIDDASVRVREDGRPVRHQVSRTDLPPGVTGLIVGPSAMLDIEVSHREYRTRVLNGIRDDVVVALEAALIHRLRLRGSLPAVADAHVTAFVNGQTARFGRDGMAAFRASAGRYELSTTFDFVKPDGVRVTAYLKKSAPESVEVSDTESAPIDVAVDVEELREVVERTRR